MTTRRRIAADGTRLSAMTAEDLDAIMHGMMGRTWKHQLAVGAGISKAQIHRYANGAQAIPQRVALLVTLMAQVVNAGLSLPMEFAEGGLERENGRAPPDPEDAVADDD